MQQDDSFSQENNSPSLFKNIHLTELDPTGKNDAIAIELATLIVENTPQSAQKLEEIVSTHDTTFCLINENPILIFAMLEKNIEACKILLKYKVNTEITGKTGLAEDGTALHLAAQLHDSRFLDLMLEHGVNINARGYMYQDTPLIRAIQNQAFDNAQTLIEHNANLDLKDACQLTALFHAVEVAEPQMVVNLIEAGADYEITNAEGQNLLHFNLIHGNFESYPVEDEIINPGEEINSILIQAGCYMEVPDNTGNHPLHYACRHKRFKAAQELVLNDVNVNVQNNKLLTPLHYAVQKKSLFLINLLLSNKANPNLRDINGNTPLHYAAQLDFLPAIRLLIRHGADKTATNASGARPIDLTTNIIAANLLITHKNGQTFSQRYKNATEQERQLAFQYYLMAKDALKQNQKA